MITWINLFEKYRVDRRLLELYRNELRSLSDHSRYRPSIEEAILHIERIVHATERILAHYGEGALTHREALRFADERLFLAYRYLYGLTMEATASEMGISRDTVYRIRRRIIAKGAVPPAILQKYGITDLTTRSLSVSPDDPADLITAFPFNETAAHASSPSEAFPTADGGLFHPTLPCPAPSDKGNEDTADILAACFAGAPTGVPGALLNRRLG